MVTGKYTSSYALDGLCAVWYEGLMVLYNSINL